MCINSDTEPRLRSSDPEVQTHVQVDTPSLTLRGSSGTPDAPCPELSSLSLNLLSLVNGVTSHPVLQARNLGAAFASPPSLPAL